jgi:hypothetical protein
MVASDVRADGTFYTQIDRAKAYSFWSLLYFSLYSVSCLQRSILWLPSCETTHIAGILRNPYDYDVMRMRVAVRDLLKIWNLHPIPDYQ